MQTARKQHYLEGKNRSRRPRVRVLMKPVMVIKPTGEKAIERS